MIIYHNPRCAKSREALNLLIEKGIEPHIRPYLTEPLTKKELKALLKKLNISAHALIRQNETYFKQNLKGKKLSESQLIDEMLNNPSLIERPILEKGEKAVIGRPVEKVLEFLMNHRL